MIYCDYLCKPFVTLRRWCSRDVEESGTNAETDCNRNEVITYQYVVPTAPEYVEESAFSSELNKAQLSEEEQLQLAIVMSEMEIRRSATEQKIAEEEALELTLVISRIEEEERNELQLSAAKLKNYYSAGTPEGCIVCRSAAPSHILQDCRHMVCCEDCAGQFKVWKSRNEVDGSTSCPVCRTPLSRLPMKVFF